MKKNQCSETRDLQRQDAEEGMRKRGEGGKNKAEGWKEEGGCQRENAELGSSC